MDRTAWRLGDPHPHMLAHGGPIGYNWLMFRATCHPLFHKLKQQQRRKRKRKKLSVSIRLI